VGRTFAAAALACALLFSTWAGAVSRAATATIAMRSATSAQNGVASTLSIPVPATTQPGDVLLAVVDVQYQPSITGPAGWQRVRADVSPGGNRLEQAVYVHTAGSNEPASYTWSFSSSHGAIGGIVDYTGVDPVSPIEASGVAFSTSQLSITAPSVTTTVANSRLLGVFSVQGDHPLTLPSSLAPAYAVGMNSVVGEKLSTAAGDRAIASAGATGALSASVAQSSTGIGQSIALMPATSAGGGGQNQPPVVDSVSVSPASPLTNDLLSAVVTAHDPDGDPLSFTYQWVLNAVDLPGATQATLDLSLPGNGSRGDTLSVRVTANDGRASSSPRTSSAVTVGDSPPAATVTLSTSSPQQSSLLTASVQATDADGDTISLTYTWTVNGATVRTRTTSSQSDTLDLSTACSCKSGDRVAVQVVPSDGTLTGAAATATATVGSSGFGTIVGFPLPGAAKPSGLTSGPDGNIWFTSENQPSVGRVNVTTGAITTFAVPSNLAGLGGIVTGRDGNLWFTETKAVKVARIVPSTGQITEFPTSVMGAGIVAGSDGNLWVVATGANRILVVSTAGKVLRTFTVPTASSSPHGPTLGPDGNVYFAEVNGNKIGRITPTGVFKEWVLPHAGSKPFVTAFGPDGRLYATENAGNRIARLDVSAGTIVEFGVPTPSSAPAGIAAEPDGNLWFAEQNANKLARITTSGAITEFPLSTPSAGPDKVAAGSDGNVWFTEHTANGIGRFALH
jgi:streptogramin lyase